MDYQIVTVIATILLGLVVASTLRKRDQPKPPVQEKPQDPQRPPSKNKFNPPSMTSEGSLPPPGTKTFTAAELAEFNGTDASKPVYLAVKGTVFDVSKARDMYEPGKGYSVFAGKDASKALGMSSLKPEDCISDYSGLGEESMATLNKWAAYYEKKYPIMGKVV